MLEEKTQTHKLTEERVREIVREEIATIIKEIEERKERVRKDGVMFGYD